MKPAYRPDIDGLRAFAILSVVLFHTGLSWLPSGYVGVDIFFVISGYLIGGIIFAEIHAKKFSFANFYARRARRILPALMVVVLAICGMGSLLLTSAELTDLATSCAAALLGVANIKFFLRNDYFQSDSELLPMLMTWSLGVEEQFYLFFPFVLLAMARLNAKRTGLALGLLSAASFIASVVVTKTHPTAAFYLLPLRAWEMGAGAMLAMRHATQLPNTHSGSTSGSVGLALMLASMVVFDETTPFPGIAAAMPVAGALLLIHSPHSLVNRKLLSAPPLVMLGLISYSWYLWHWPLMAFARHLSPESPPLPLMLAIAAISGIVAYASWRWIERPFRNYKGSAPRTLAYYGVALSLVLAVPLALKFSHGWPSRLPQAVVSLEHTQALGRGSCLAPFGATLPDASPDCQPQGTNSAIALLGDSHASALGPGLLAYAQSKHMRLLQFTKSACTPLLGMGAIESAYPSHPLECGKFMAIAVEKIAADKTIKTVIVAGAWPAPGVKNYYEISANGQGEWKNTESALREGLPALLSRLHQGGKKVIVMGDVPGFRFDPPRQLLNELLPTRAWLSNRLQLGQPMPHGIAPETTVKPRADTTQLIAQAALHSGAKYVDLYPEFCPELTDKTGCRFVSNGELLFIDYHHLSTLGSRAVPWKNFRID